jgi:hypothetical protein
MKRVILLIIPVFLLFSCKKEKDNSFPNLETVTQGSKWSLKIGSSYLDTYTQLQQLGKEKNILDVAVIRQQPISSLDQIQYDLQFYNAVSIESTTGTQDRVEFQFNQDKISSIQTGGTQAAEVTKWPQDVADNLTIKKDDPVSGLYAKLQAIYQMPAYQTSYRIILPDKPLDKPFAPDMANSSEWLFYYFEDVKSGRSGRYTVSLIFKDGKLNKITSEYAEFDVYI